MERGSVLTFENLRMVGNLACPLVLEVFRAMREDYKALSDEAFLTIAYERIKRISTL